MGKTIVRSLVAPVVNDLREKMVFVSGPRQVGKTTLARQVLERMPGAYFNWDNRDDRRAISSRQWPPTRGVVALDEIDKYRTWKRFLKGEYDNRHEQYSFLVTGSARLDVYRKGGDSLQGRYHHHRMHPFTLGEVVGGLNAPIPMEPLDLSCGNTPKETLDTLARFGGFPEPFIKASERALRRWQKERFDRVIREDVRDLSNVRDLGSIQLLAEMLPARVGSPLSLNSLREDLEVSQSAMTHWIELLELLYFCHRIYPFASGVARSLKKQAKLYIWDWASVEDSGSRFENMIAGHLLKLCHFLEDNEGYKAVLWYLQDRNKHEVDFLITIDRKPWFAVEAKLSNTGKNNLRYFREKLKIPCAYCVALDESRFYESDGVIYAPAGRFLAALGV
jgi:uncharacterized protein